MHIVYTPYHRRLAREQAQASFTRLILRCTRFTLCIVYPLSSPRLCPSVITTHHHDCVITTIAPLSGPFRLQEPPGDASQTHLECLRLHNSDSINIYNLFARAPRGRFCPPSRRMLAPRAGTGTGTPRHVGASRGHRHAAACPASLVYTAVISFQPFIRTNCWRVSCTRGHTPGGVSV